MNAQLDVNAAAGPRANARPHAAMLYLAMIAPGALSPIPVPAAQLVVGAAQVQYLEDDISADIDAGMARKLASIREQVDRELRRLPAQHQWQLGAKLGIEALCGAVEFDLQQVVHTTDY